MSSINGLYKTMSKRHENGTDRSDYKEPFKFCKKQKGQFNCDDK